MIQATPPVPLGALRSPNILRGGQLVLAIPANRGGRAAPLGDASDPLVRLDTALAPVTGQFLLVTRTPEPPGVDSPRRTPVTPCGCLGSPCPDSLDRPSQAPTLGSPRRFGGVSWNASGPTCSRALSTRCSIDLAGPLVRVRRFRCVSHQLPHGLIPILLTVAAYLPRYHGHQSTRSGPQSVAASNPFYQSPLRDSRPAP